MINNFIQTTLVNAHYELLEDGSYCGTIPGFRGVLVNSKTLKGCKKELAEVLEEWMLIKVSRRQIIKGFVFKAPRPQSLQYA